ncbi:MAG: flippase-like domain-containing protein [Clostridia bacterium]|nr:flippase-like domain-containing protein [Clostridia bacterium]
MKEKLKKHGWTIYITGASAAVLIIVFANTDIRSIGSAFKQLRPVPTAGAGLCIAAYFCLRAVTTDYYLRLHGYRLSMRELLGVTGTGEFYSAVTPSASGGQPAQVVRLVRCGVPASVGTACMSIKFVGFQLAYLALGAVLWLGQWDEVAAHLYGFRWLVGLGFLLNLGLVGLVLLTIPRSRLLERLSGFAVGVLARIHVLRDPEKALSRFLGAVQEYRDALRQLFSRPRSAAVLLLLSLAEALCYFGMPVMLCHAFGLTGTADILVLTLHVLLFVASAFLPLPGAAGASESGFCIFLAGVYPADDIAAAMLCWRFFSYYLLLLLGFAAMTAGKRGKKEV